ncbi:hypothetical protein [Pseudoalteromonas spongiae]|uniref:hypothetical protein n=1 Tax=Pseudoalteromonas spongiae TaxID=298657 RepID=UPI00110B9928|nr:hypothetical protein [Pseudoalteromonas spongiae]TMO85567.1 hypothetical protein CWC15_07535 [Pseudoalteromonas spongiae]
MDMQLPHNTTSPHLFSKTLVLILAMSASSAFAGVEEQANRIHTRLTGVSPSATVLENMVSLLEAGKGDDAAKLAMENDAFYRVTLKDWVTPWTNRDFDVHQPLNDYTATIMGVVRDDLDFRSILFDDIIYTAAASANVPNYSISNNDHYAALEQSALNLKDTLTRQTQSSVTNLPIEATSGVITSRAASKAFFIAGTNRAMFRYTFINHMCTDLDALKDTSIATNRIRQDVSRSPGGDSRIFMNSCSGCHSGMDPMAQAYAYYNFEYDRDNDLTGENGQLSYQANTVQGKYHINSETFKFGFITESDKWDNYWRQGLNRRLGWDEQLSGSGNGAKSLGKEIAYSEQFASCQVSKVFEKVCLRKIQNQQDATTLATITDTFKSSGYKLKTVFAATANYCKGD